MTTVRTSLSKGIAFALAACFIWGFIFVVPQFMPSFSPLEIATGRFFVFGVVSSCILMRSGFNKIARFPLKIWLKAAGFSLVYSFGYYIFVILSLRFSTPAICALIMGISPIVIAFYGNWRERECTNKSLLLPSLLILVGLVAINAPHIMASEAPATYLLGVVCAMWAMLGWSWYVVANSSFLKKNPEVDSSDWSTVIGVSTLFWVAVFGLSAIFLFDDQFTKEKFVYGSDLAAYFVGCGILGAICSWVGCFLWNKASLYLPVSLAGQLTIFETIFAICFFYTIEQSLPPMMELLGIIFMLTAIVYGVRTASQPKTGLTRQS